MLHKKYFNIFSNMSSFDKFTVFNIGNSRKNKKYRYTNIIRRAKTKKNNRFSKIKCRF